MPYKPETSYDADNKIWNGPGEMDCFNPELSIGQIIHHEMRRHPNQLAQISDTENTNLTRKELFLNSIRVSTYMRNQGLNQSDIVGIIARNTTHISAVAYACFFNGIPFHSLNIAYEQDTIEKLYKVTEPRLIFCDGDEYEKIQAATKELDVKIITMRNHTSDSISIDDVLATPIEEDFEPSRLEKGNDQTLAILCSSGTTGTPKAVTVINSRKLLFGSYNLSTDDIQYTHSSLDWITGLLTTVTSGIYSTTRIIADNPFDPVRFLRLLEKYKITWLLQAPSHMAMIVNSDEFEKTNFSSLKYYLYGGGRCSAEVQNQIRSRLKSNCLFFVYGFTELGSMATMNFNYDEKPNSVGRLVAGCKLKIINDDGETLPPNEMGEVCIYNGQYWAGYFGNSKESHNIRDSKLWFHTGDLGYVDNDGFLYIVERKKDMLKYQNIMYYPNEIEDVISRMPEVAEVCVFGVWDQINGDEAAAAVVKRVGTELHAEDVVDYVNEHVGAKYKQLHGGALIVDDLMRSSNGKTNRIATKKYFLQVKDRS
ncbi:uncharacterized protein Dwil_GK22353 [Drosophila willistoni]|uniref:AMP-dependent synthetase/ligase domain-containing protein n=1 Tax=Drosophila willistoni TaxID=7260 RepID=B4NEZ7_DROWI|nr:luciferin 4-monooxygenase [Drosophila willistoni]EDW83372.2 uncharacterized protein Dwil_GK22353 [Drosophila willistoni]